MLRDEVDGQTDRGGAHIDDISARRYAVAFVSGRWPVRGPGRFHGGSPRLNGSRTTTATDRLAQNVGMACPVTLLQLGAFDANRSVRDGIEAGFGNRAFAMTAFA